MRNMFHMLSKYQVCGVSKYSLCLHISTLPLEPCMLCTLLGIIQGRYSPLKLSWYLPTHDQVSQKLEGDNWWHLCADVTPLKLCFNFDDLNAQHNNLFSEPNGF